MFRRTILLLSTLFVCAAAAQQQSGQKPRDYRLHLQTGAFDPLTTQRYAAGTTAPATPYAIVQLQRTPTRAERQSLQRRYGLLLTDYIPNYAYVERLDAKTLQSLTQDPLYRAHVPYAPEFKLSPKIGKRRFRTPERQAVAGLWLELVLFRQADPAPVAEAARTRGTRVKVVDDRKAGGAAKVRVIVPSMNDARAFAQLPAVRWIDEVPEVLDDNGNTAGTMQSGAVGNTPYWDLDIRGQGQIVGIMDRIIDIDHCFFEDPTDNTVRPDHRKIVGFRNPDGTGVLSHGTFVAGIVAGDDFNDPFGDPNRGMLPSARITYGDRIQVTSGDVSMLSYLQAAKSDGAAVHTNSFHDNDTGYPQMSVDTDTFVWNNEEALVFGSAGNAGESIGPPGTAKNAVCMAAGATAPNQLIVGDGNPGPTDDNRRKPELVAPGCNITSSTVSTACGTNLSGCATSWATPAAASAATLVRQFYMEGWYPTGTRQPHDAFVPTGALLKATLLNSTLDMTDPGYPNDTEGWGLLQLDRVLALPGSARDVRLWDTPHAQGLLGGDAARTHLITVDSNAEPLKVTLVWADAPGAAGAARSQVNDLDLTVTSPDGTQTFLGNRFVGGVSVTGGAADADNNVEMVLVNAPAPGVWTITVTPTNVTVGNPAQGYALVATADMPESPAPTGNQNTLVVPVRFNDIPTGPSMANINTRVLNAVDYFDTVSYGETTILPETTALVDLDNETSFYYDPSRSLLVELVQEVVTKLGAAAFTRGTADPADDIARMVIVTNDASFTGDWATTGAWPYDIPGGATRPISVSIHSDANDDARFSHGLSHQFGLVDLYAHPGVTFARPQYADHWDNMATPFENEHPLAWSKQRAEWLTAHGATITFIPRPAAGVTTTSAALQLFPQDLPGANRKAIAIGLTPGSTLATENVFYFVEARDTSAPYDTNLPAEGVLVYLVNETIPQGQGPVILRDPNAGTDALEAFAVPSTPHTIPGTGITIEVLAPTGGALANIRVTYAAPATDFNLRITRGDTRNGVFRAWYSPDIWLDSPANGENFATSPPPEDQIERPIPGEPNRIRVRIFNDGPAIAENFDVRVRISEPYHTIGDQADFDTIVGLIHVDGLVPTGQAVPPGMLASGSVLTFVWTPADTGNAHSCVWVEFLNVSGTDVNANDNAAQENLERITSETGSPYHPTEFHFQMENPYAEAALFYFRVDGAPDDWTIVLDPKKVRLLPGQQIEGKLTVTPPENEKLCSSRVLEVTSWTPRGDTLIPVGGSVVQVDMRRPTVLTLDVGEDKCRGDDFEEVLGGQRHCRRVTASGCTNPPQPNTRIWLRYKAPDGTSIWHEVMTDANGCYEDFLVTSEGTEWSVTAGFEGNDCQGPTRTGPKGEGGGRPAFGGLGDDWWYSLHLGHNFPLGDLRKSFASGPSITIDLEREWRDRWSIYAMLGYHYFDAKFPGGDETYFTNLSLNLRAYAAAGPWRRFIGFGPGLYRQEGGSTEGGLNVSAGLEFPIVTSLRLETGADLHLVDPTGDRRMFIDVKLGVKWRF